MHLQSTHQQINPKGDLIRLAYISYQECKPPEWWEENLTPVPEKAYQVWYILEIPAVFGASEWPHYIPDIVLSLFEAAQIQLEEDKWLVSEFLEDPPQNPRGLVRSRIRNLLSEANEYSMKRMAHEFDREFWEAEEERRLDDRIGQVLENLEFDSRMERFLP